MLYYDYSLTLSMELEHFWKKARLSLVSVLFVVNRYLGLLGSIPVALEYFVHFEPEVSVHFAQLFLSPTDCELP